MDKFLQTYDYSSAQTQFVMIIIQQFHIKYKNNI
jgi:hypothetical protein